MALYTGGAGGGYSSSVSAAASGGGFGYGGAMLVSSLFSAISNIYMGQVAEDIAGFNADVIESKMRLIQMQKDIEFGQYQRAKHKMIGTSMAKIAKAGIQLSGSAIAVVTKNYTQMTIDQAIGNFNYEMQKSYTQSEADRERLRGRTEKYAYRTQAYSDLLKGSSSYARYKGFDLSGGAKESY